MPSVANELTIKAPLAKVWAVLTDTNKYWEWNPRLVKVEGSFAPGAVVRLHYKDLGHTWMPTTYEVNVEIFSPGDELRWSGPRSGLGKSLLRAEHVFRLRERSEGTKVTHGEVFAGAFAGLLWGKIGPAVNATHAAMNSALRARCEAP